MAVLISMLRGVNVGQHNRMKMEALRAVYESLKLRDPQTYVQSGNVVFRAKEQDLDPLARRIEKAIEGAFGFRPDVILRTTTEMRDAIARNPFRERSGIDPSRLLVTFLAVHPPEEARDKVLHIECAPEELRIDGREMYIYYPNGQARPTVPWATIEKALATRGTARNWNSVTKLLEMAERMEAAG